MPAVLREPDTPTAMLVSDHFQCGALSDIAQPPKHASNRCVLVGGIQGLYLSISCKRVCEHALFFPQFYFGTVGLLKWKVTQMYGGFLMI